MNSGIFAIGPGLYSATIAMRSKIEVGLRSFMYLLIPGDSS